MNHPKTQKSRRGRGGLGLACVFLALAGCSTAKAPPPNTVASVDLGRYAGTWHEVARFANWFQDGNGQYAGVVASIIE